MRKLLLLYWILCFTLTHLPPGDVPEPPFPGFDKLVHIALYALLIFLLARTRPTLPAWKLIAIAVLYGIFDELTQIPVGRTAEFSDLAADTSGAAGTLLIRSFGWRRKRRSPIK